jgi:6-phosphogluconolactonase
MSLSGNPGRPVVTENADVLTEEAANLFVESAQLAVSAHDMFCVALSGGSTPRPLYEKLALPPYRDQIDWHRMQVFFSDERFVPPDSPESNFHMANQALLSKVDIPERFIHQVATVDVSPAESAELYEEGIRRVLEVGLAEIPRFDLILLGLGPDGHTASLFPGSEALDVTDRIVAANFVAKLDAWRITFTYPLINAARRVVFLVQGEDKAEVVARVWSGDTDLPAARVKPATGELLWLLDAAAAAGMSDVPANREAGRTTAGDSTTDAHDSTDGGPQTREQDR